LGVPLRRGDADGDALLDWQAEAERRALADAEDEGDGPACGVAMSLGGIEDAARFLTHEWFDLVFVGHGRVDEPCHVGADLVTSEAITLPGQGCCDDP
jgi:hypothetical protein